MSREKEEKKKEKCEAYESRLFERSAIFILACDAKEMRARFENSRASEPRHIYIQKIQKFQYDSVALMKSHSSPFVTSKV